MYPSGQCFCCSCYRKDKRKSSLLLDRIRSDFRQLVLLRGESGIALAELKRSGADRVAGVHLEGLRLGHDWGRWEGVVDALPGVRVRCEEAKRVKESKKIFMLEEWNCRGGNESAGSSRKLSGTSLYL